MFKLLRKAVSPDEQADGANPGAIPDAGAAEQETAATEENDPTDMTGENSDAPPAADATEEPIFTAFGQRLDETPTEVDREEAMSVLRLVVDTVRADAEENREDLFDLILKGVDYDRALAEAETRGEIRGRNARIEEEKNFRFEGDGVPHPGTGGNTYDSPQPSIFELARGAW